MYTEKMKQITLLRSYLFSELKFDGFHLYTN